jgi:hypothetical protein
VNLSGWLGSDRALGLYNLGSPQSINRRTPASCARAIRREREGEHEEPSVGLGSSSWKRGRTTCSSCIALSSAVTSTRQRAGISPSKNKAHRRAASSVDSPACAPSTGMDTFGQLIIFSISRSKQSSRPRSWAAWSTLVGRARL